MTDQPLVHIEDQPPMLMEAEPDVVLGAARTAAKALQNVIDQKPKKVMMGGEQYLEFEDWQTLGRFYGITAKEDGDAEFVDLAGIQGFKANAVALFKGQVLSRATAYCLNDEDKWSARTKYAWAYVKRSGGYSVEDPGKDELIWESKDGKSRPKKERINLGEEKVPLYQLASMAQTRANAKALRNVLAWVAVLAGYRPTPAEELPVEHIANKPEAKPEKTITKKQLAEFDDLIKAIKAIDPTFDADLFVTGYLKLTILGNLRADDYDKVKTRFLDRLDKAEAIAAATDDVNTRLQKDR